MDGAGDEDSQSNAASHSEPSIRSRSKLWRKREKAPSTVASRLARTLTFRSQQTVQLASESPDDVRGPYGLVLLASPSEPVVDFVFVHGLRGGSRKTWSESDDPMHFWPKQWLPYDPEFSHVRIHSFGYKADWREHHESILNIHDFGKSLLGALYDSPLIRRDASIPLVMIGHSMGGLVIKKAYILARRDTAYSGISERFHTMFFIATPHRGADSAQFLFNLIRATNQGSQPYLADLAKNSISVESINDEFRHICDHLKLCSFYETLPTTVGMKSSIIVQKDSAILGYAQERTALINANHRGVCKFDSPEDSNYLIVRNALASTVDDIVTSLSLRLSAPDLKTRYDARRMTLPSLMPGLRPVNKWLTSTGAESKIEEQREQKRRIEEFLSIRSTPEDEYLRLNDLRARDSCDWLLDKSSFQNWRDSGPHNIYWLIGNPASGKSVLSTHVIEHLEESNRTCAYFFFTQDTKSESNLSTCLRSLAYQMALSNVYIRDSLLTVIDDGFQLPTADFRAIWRKLFKGSILQTKLYQPYYWVIDGLDECNDRHELVNKLEEIDENYPLRIFITSRPGTLSPQSLESLNTHMESISEDDTSPDIRSLVEANMHQFPAKDDSARQMLIQEIVEKAEGSFLWVKLVTDELRDVYSPKDVRKILDSVPTGMDALYSRILSNMEQAHYGKEVAKAVLRWTALSARPLKVEELNAALQLDIEDSILNLAENVATICGNLVYVDSKSRIRMIHQTVREYLLQSHTKSEFAIQKALCHKRLAMVCLEYLKGDEMKAPRGRRSSTLRLTPTRSAFVTYASTCFHEHIRGSSSKEEEVLTSLNSFLTSSNVLCWIELVAISRKLDGLVATGKMIQDFVQRRKKHASPLGRELQSLTSWSVDLLRLVPKFGQQLSTAPWSIYNLVAPFCPPQSSLQQQFGASSQSLVVKGLSSQSWDDRISSYIAQGEHTSSLAYSDSYYAVGYSSGLVNIFRASTCQAVSKHRHEELVKCLQFSHSEKLLAAGGLTNICVFDVHTGQQIMRLKTQQQCLAMQFSPHDQSMTAALRSNETVTWELSSGNLLGRTKLQDEPEMGQQSLALRSPNAAAFSQSLDLLAIVFRAPAIMLWDLRTDSFYGYCDRESSDDPVKRATQSWPMDAVFNPLSTTSLLAAVYWDGELVLFDPLENRIVDRIMAGGEVLQCSPDGRTLATGDSAGNIQLFEFETLKVLYRINSWDHGIKSLAFSQDGRRFVDIRGSTCNVWEPPELIRQEPTDQNSDSDALSHTAKEVDLVDDDDLVMITAIAVQPAGRFIICGKDDGSVCLYHPQTGLQVRVLYSHPSGSAIIHVKYDMKSNVVASCDDSSTVLVHRFSEKPGPESGRPLLRVKIEESISQLLILEESIMVISYSAARTFDMNGYLLQTISRKQEAPTSTSVDHFNGDERSSPAHHTEARWKWLVHPLNATKAIVFGGTLAKTIALEQNKTAAEVTFPFNHEDEGVVSTGAAQEETVITILQNPPTVTPCFDNRYIAISLPSSSPREPPSLVMWSVGEAHQVPETSTHGAIPGLSEVVARIIGSVNSKLVFIDKHNWVSSVELGADQYARHFCIPFDWLSMNDLIIEVTPTVIVVVRRNEIAVVRNGFAFREFVSLETE